MIALKKPLLENIKYDNIDNDKNNNDKNNNDKNNNNSNKLHDIIIKIITVGDCNTGKTTMISSLDLINEKYNTNKEYIPTIGIDFNSILVEYDEENLTQEIFTKYKRQNINKIYNEETYNEETYDEETYDEEKENIFKNGLKIKANIWDTTGNERFISLTQMYYKQCTSIILVFDLTNKESFDNLYIWLDRISEIIYLDDVHITLIGNKKDLQYKKKSISREEIESFLQSNSYLHINYYECNSLDVKEVQDIFTKELLNIYINRVQYDKNIEYFNPLFIPKILKHYYIDDNNEKSKKGIKKMFKCCICM